jgi:predicted lipoprotein with Yx(FWY)xxD motif
VVLEPPPPIPDWVTFQPSDAGELMADADGNTLYVHDLTKPRAFGIGIGRDMARPDLWIPVYADENDQPVGLWSIVEADNGRRQWAHMGLKLYIHKRDLGEPGALNGQRSTDRVWRTIMTSGQTMAGSGN